MGKNMCWEEECSFVYSHFTIEKRDWKENMSTNRNQTNINDSKTQGNTQQEQGTWEKVKEGISDTYENVKEGTKDALGMNKDSKDKQPDAKFNDNTRTQHDTHGAGARTQKDSYSGTSAAKDTHHDLKSGGSTQQSHTYGTNK